MDKFLLLIISSDNINYNNIFNNCNVLNYNIIIEQVIWNDISVCSMNGNKICISIDKENKIIYPDFILYRESCSNKEWYKHLVTFVHSNIPTINTSESLVILENKALSYGKLFKIQNELGGFKEFPLITQTCYSDWKSATFPPDFPCIGKIGNSISRIGKMKINDISEWDDFCSIAAMQTQYFTSERFIKAINNIRIQKIGNNYRVYQSKTNLWFQDNYNNKQEDYIDIHLEKRYKLWIDKVSDEFGMDICILDLLQEKDTNKEYILGIHSSCITLNPKYIKDDIESIKQLVLYKIEEYLLYKENKDIPMNKNYQENKEKLDKTLHYQIESLRDEITRLYNQINELETIKKEKKEKEEITKSKSTFFGFKLKNK